MRTIRDLFDSRQSKKRTVSIDGSMVCGNSRVYSTSKEMFDYARSRIHSDTFEMFVDIAEKLYHNDNDINCVANKKCYWTNGRDLDDFMEDGLIVRLSRIFVMKESFEIRFEILEKPRVRVRRV